MAIITLTTDFGTADEYVGTMKGVILGLAPAVRIVDLSHEIEPQHVHQAAHVLARAVPFFPLGTVHVAVVDPGVGSERRPLAVQAAQATFVGPDNGLFTFVLNLPDARAWALDRPKFWLPHISHTFHGRDIFAPVAAHLSLGVPANQLGSPVHDPVRLPQRTPEQIGNHRIVGHVVHIDRFGNLISNIPAAWLADDRWICEISEHRIQALSKTYASAAPGALLALVGSGGTLEVAQRAGSAAQLIGAVTGDRIELRRA